MGDLENLQRATKALVHCRAEQSVSNEHVERRIGQMERELRSSMFDCRHASANIVAKHREMLQLIQDASRGSRDASDLTARLDVCVSLKKNASDRCAELLESVDSHMNQLSCFPSETAQVIKAARERAEAIEAQRETLTSFESFRLKAAQIVQRDAIDDMIETYRRSVSCMIEDTKGTDSRIITVKEKLQEITAAETELKTNINLAQARELDLINEIRSVGENIQSVSARLTDHTQRRALIITESQAYGLRQSERRSELETLRQSLAQASVDIGDAERHLASEQDALSASQTRYRESSEAAEKRATEIKAQLLQVAAHQLDREKHLEDLETRAAGIAHRLARFRRHLLLLDLGNLMRQREQAFARRQEALSNLRLTSLQREAWHKLQLDAENMELEETLSRAVIRGDCDAALTDLCALERFERLHVVRLVTHEAVDRRSLSEHSFKGSDALFRAFCETMEKFQAKVAQKLSTPPGDVLGDATRHVLSGKKSSATRKRTSTLADVAEETQTCRSQPVPSSRALAHVVSRPRTLRLAKKDSPSSRESSTGGWTYAELRTPAPRKTWPSEPWSSTATRRALFTIEKESPNPRTPPDATPSSAQHRKTKPVKRPGVSECTPAAAKNVFDIFDL